MPGMTEFTPSQYWQTPPTAHVHQLSLITDRFVLVFQHTQGGDTVQVEMQTNLHMHLQAIISHADATASLVGQPEDSC